MPQLTFFQGKTPLFQIQLQSSSTEIGRSESCDVVLREPKVSRRHAVIYRIDDQYLIKKTGRGTLKVNDCEIESQPLQDQDRIEIGPWSASFSAGESEEKKGEETLITNTRSGRTQSVARNSRGFISQDLKLKIHQPNREPFFYSVDSNLIAAGADANNDIVLEDPYVSSNHLKFVFEREQIWLYDLASTNGTFVNGVKVREAELEVGQVVKLGQSHLTLLDEGKLEQVVPIMTQEFCGLVGSSQRMRELYGMLGRMGPTEATLLILGESGSGKELVAQAAHQISERRQGPFIAINCGAISKELIESELFGHEKGAFTGAQRQHIGAFGQAKGGTLFLDEIGELPLELQPKLLRALENKTYRRVGGSEEQIADVRIITATHRDLAELVKNHQFREDLFFRLFVLPVYVPTLRERLEDLSLLSETFLKEFSVPGNPKTLSEAAMEKLRGHRFPGNVRELRNVLLRSVLLSKKSEIESEDIVFPEDFSSAPKEYPFSGIEKLEDMERKLFLKALITHNWNKAKAADSLGIAKSTLFSKIRLYDLEKLNKNEG